MKKNFLIKFLPLIIILVAFGMEASAQYSVGLHGGMNLSNYSGKYQNSNFETKTGMVLGLVVQKQQNDWLSFQAELNYDQWGANYNRVINDGIEYTTEYNDIEQDANYLTLPLLAKFDIGEKHKVFGFGGLYFGYLLSANINGTETVTNKTDPDDVETTPVNRDYKDDISNFDMGAVLGLGVDFRVSDAMGIFIDGRYNWGWVNTASPGEGNLFNSVWTFNLGLMYHIAKKD
jgi:hypothetical protein